MAESEDESMSTQEIIALLKTPDFILDGAVERVLEPYLASKESDVDMVVDCLSTNYRGSANMCKLMTDWLEQLGFDKAEPQASTSEAKADEHEADLKKGDKKGKAKGRARQKREKKDDPADAPTTSDPALSAVTACAENTMATFLKRHFKSECADRIFDESGGGIEWLSELISHKRWRQIIYELVDQNPHCLMLKFAVKLISDAGHQREIVGVQSASDQLEIYSRVLVTAIDAVLTEHRRGEHTEKYEAVFAELQKIVSQGEHTYLYASALLEALSRTSTGMSAAACHHVMQSLRTAVKGREHETTAIRCALLHTQEEQVEATVIQALLTMTSKGELNPADMTQVYQQYILPHPPPVEAIRDPLFIHMLVDSIFHCDGPRVNVEHREKYIYLLAYASSVSETFRNGRRAQMRVDLDIARVAIERTAAAVEAADDVAVELPNLLREARFPVVATGLLHYAETLLLADNRMGDPPLWVFVLVDQVAAQHPNLHSTAFALCLKLYEKVSLQPDASEVIMERQRILVDRFVHLLSIGFTIPVLQKVNQMFRNSDIDASLVRYFTLEVLEIISPPYTKEFCKLFLPLIADEEIFDKALREKTPIAGEFLAYCQSNYQMTSCS
ncbi:unnamed protein product, partial [Mesorhabditis spiculigera]